ncbi:MAG: DUF6048 family protein [Flavobacteriales bacterium Tduv]
MNKLFIKILTISILYSDIVHKQSENPVETIKEEQSTLDTASAPPEQKAFPIIYDYALYIELDSFAPVRGWFNRKNTNYQEVAALRVYKKFHMAFEIGRSFITYDRLNWKANIQGVYIKQISIGSCMNIRQIRIKCIS